MNTKQLVLIPLLILLAIGIGFGFFISVRETYRYITGGTPQSFSPGIMHPPRDPDLAIQKESDGKSVTITWNNLPGGTDHLDVYRAHIGLDDWELWQTIFLFGNKNNGSATFFFASGENPDDYIYYTESGSSGNGEGWTSPPGAAEDPPPPPPAPPPPPGPPPPGPPPPPAPPPPPGPPPPPAPGPTSTPDVYYTPEIQISGYGDPNVEHFWVQHVNNFIEMGWQLLATSTDRLVVSRSTDANGPWEKLLEQHLPIIVGPYTFRVIDSSISSPHYYLLQTYAGETELEQYGPAYLEAAGQ